MDSTAQVDILFISPSYPPNYCGVGKFTSQIIRILEKNNHNCYLITNKHQNNENFTDRINGVSKFSLIDINLTNLPNIIKAIYKIKPKTINIQYNSVEFKRNLFPNFLPILLKIFFPNIIIQVTIHEFYIFTRLGKLRNFISTLVANKIFFSDFQQLNSYNKFTKNIFEQKTNILPLGANIPINELYLDETKYKKINQKIKICFHGLIQAKNGLEYLINALSKIDSSKYELNILGDLKLLVDYGSEAKSVKLYQDFIKELIIKTGVTVNFLGDIDPKSPEFREILQKQDLFILPDVTGITVRRSSFWNVFLQSKILALVSYTENESEDLFKDHLIIFKPKSSEEIYNKIKEVIEFDDIKLKEVYQNQQKLREKYSPENLEQQIVKLFETQ